MVMREVTYDSELANLLKTNKGIITTVNSMINVFLYDSGHVNSQQQSFDVTLIHLSAISSSLDAIFWIQKCSLSPFKILLP